MKNAGVGVGLPDWGRCRLVVSGGKVHIQAGASCIGQGLGTVLVQMCCEELRLPAELVVYERANTFDAPDSGTTSGSRQTLITGEACRRACGELRADLAEKSLAELEGKDYYGEYLAKTDPLGADVPNPVSHVAYGYATQLCILGEDGRIRQLVAAHDVGRVVNPMACEGQIEGGVVMSMGFALTEEYPVVDCRPTAKFGTLGLFKANQVPEIKAILVEKPGLAVAGGAIGIGEITSIPTAPAIADAYYRYDGRRRYSLPLEDTPYSRKRNNPRPFGVGKRAADHGFPRRAFCPWAAAYASWPEDGRAIPARAAGVSTSSNSAAGASNSRSASGCCRITQLPPRSSRSARSSGKTGRGKCTGSPARRRGSGPGSPPGPGGIPLPPPPRSPGGAEAGRTPGTWPRPPFPGPPAPGGWYG